MSINTRPSLGPFLAAECLLEMRLHVEDLAGRGPVLGAGRMRGSGLVTTLGLAGSQLDAEQVATTLRSALGVDGTRLCVVEELTHTDTDVWTVKVTEAVCGMVEGADEPMCAYTLGVFIGAIATISGRTMMGRERQCQAMGAPACSYRIEPHLALT